jgi:hypothetical protein
VFRDDPEQRRSVATLASRLCGKVFGFVKRNLSGAQRRTGVASGERGADSLPFSQVFFKASVRFRVASKPGKPGCVGRAESGLKMSRRKAVFSVNVIFYTG